MGFFVFPEVRSISSIVMGYAESPAVLFGVSQALPELPAPLLNAPIPMLRVDSCGR